MNDFNARSLRVEANAMLWLDNDANWQRWENEVINWRQIARAYAATLAEYLVLRYKIMRGH